MCCKLKTKAIKSDNVHGKRLTFLLTACLGWRFEEREIKRFFEIEYKRGKEVNYRRNKRFLFWKIL